MDNQRFDELTKRLGRVLSRRTAWQGSLAGVLGLAGFAAGTADAEAQDRRFRSQHCLPNHMICQPRRGNRRAIIRYGARHNHRCGKCCSKFSRPVGRRGARKCACVPNGRIARGDDQCCTGFRADRRCANRPAPPPTRCLGATLEGTAQQVSNGYRLESVCDGSFSGTFGAVDFNVPQPPFVFTDITTLEATFTMVEGTCKRGTPRFSLVRAGAGPNIFIYPGPAADPATCPGSGAQNPGNLIDPTSTARRFDVGGAPMTYAEAAQALQGVVFTDIFFNVDASHCDVAGERQVVVVNPCVNVRP